MQYKTIILEMLQQRTELHEQLRQERKLLRTLEIYARELKESHEAIREQLRQARPDSDPSQISSEAFEIALKELEDRLPPVSQEGRDILSLDEAMSHIQAPSRRG
jgi:chromosome segregation ATPase